MLLFCGLRFKIHQNNLFFDSNNKVIEMEETRWRSENLIKLLWFTAKVAIVDTFDTTFPRKNFRYPIPHNNKTHFWLLMIFHRFEMKDKLIGKLSLLHKRDVFWITITLDKIKEENFQRQIVCQNEVRRMPTWKFMNF